MHYLLLVGALLFFVFIAPLKTTAMLVGVGLLISLVVKVSAQAIGDISVSLPQAFRSVAYSLAFVAIALFTLGSFSIGTGMSQFSGIAGLAVLGGLFFAYALGFKVGLGTSAAASAGIAIVSTVASGPLLWLAIRA
jgi:hypothetical protein